MSKVSKYYKLFAPLESKDRTRWPQIGVLFDHGDKLTGEIYCTPLTGRIVGIESTPKAKADGPVEPK